MAFEANPVNEPLKEPVNEVALTLPDTSSFAPGDVEPIPTLAFPSKYNLAVPALIGSPPPDVL